MKRIRFETGEVVDVDDHATDDDIDEIYQQIRQPKQQASQTPMEGLEAIEPSIKRDPYVEPSLGQKVLGAGEAGLATGINLVGSVLGAVPQAAGAIGQVMGKGDAEELARPYMPAQYVPHTETGKEYAENINKAVFEPLMAIAPNIGMMEGLNRPAIIRPPVEKPGFNFKRTPKEDVVATAKDRVDQGIQQQLTMRDTRIAAIEKQIEQLKEYPIKNEEEQVAIYQSLRERQAELEQLQKERESLGGEPTPSPEIKVEELKPVEEITVKPVEELPPDYQPHELPTDTPIRPDLANEQNIAGKVRDRILGINRNGNKSIDLGYVTKYFESLSEKGREFMKSPRGLQIFAEIHEAVHDVVKPIESELAVWKEGGEKAYESRMNQMIMDELRPYYEQRKIPRNVVENFHERFINDQPNVNKPTLPIEENPPLSAYDNLGERVPEPGVPEESLPIEAYADQQGRVELDKSFPDPNQPRGITPQTPKQVRAGIDHFEKLLADYHNSPDFGTKDPKRLEWIEQKLNDLYDQRDTLIAAGKGDDMGYAGKQQASKTSKANPEELPDSKNPVFKNDREELYQKLRNQNLSHFKAMEIVNNHFPDVHEMHLFGENPTPKASKNAEDATKLAKGFGETPYGKIAQTAEEALTQQRNVPDISSFSSKGLGNLFGKLAFGKMFEDSPTIRYAVAKLHQNRQRAVQISNSFWFGKTALERKGKIFFSLKRSISEDSPAAVIAKLKDAEMDNVMKAFEEGFYNSRSHDETFALYKDKFTETERQAFQSFQKFFDRLGDGVDVRRTGWFPAVRRGDFMVRLRKGGVPIHAEMFRTARDAENFVKEVQRNLGKDVEIDPLIDIKEFFENKDKDFELTRRVTDIIANEIAPLERERIQKLLANTVGNPDPMASHQKARSGISGYEGSRLFQNSKERAEAWKKALHSAADEYANRQFRAAVQRDLSPLLDQVSGLKEGHPNTYEAVSLLRDMAMNKIQSHVEGLDRNVYNVADNLAMKVAQATGNPHWYPKVPVWDRASGVSTRMFYIWSLTTRPAFWLGQAITSPMAIRQLFRDGSMVDALASTGKGTMNLLYGGSKDFRRAVNWVAENTETFHPSFINDLNQLLRSDQKNMANHVFEVLTGEKMSTAADSFSRYWTFSMMFEHYKAKGLSGKALYQRAAMETDSAMILYSRQEKAPIFTRAGVVGQQASPLMTFAQGNLGNLLADLRLAKKKGNLAPVAMTLVTTIGLAGAIGLPFVAEWEILRKMLLAVDPDLIEDLPSPTEWFMKNLPDEASFGLVSAGTGYDIGSGLRFNAMAGSIVDGQGGLSAFPALKFAADTIGNGITSIEHSLGMEVSEAQYRKAQMQMTPGGYKGIMDDVQFDADSRAMVPDQKRGFATVKQTPEERIASYLGTKTMKARKDNMIVFQSKEREQALNKAKQAKVDIIIDKLVAKQDVQKEIQDLVKLGMDGKEIQSAIKTSFVNRNIEAKTRQQGLSVKTLGQTKKFMDIKEYERE